MISLLYDEIAPQYDALFQTDAARAENADLFNLIGNLSADSVLDVGCGTGLVLDYTCPRCYTGIDPSPRMIAALKDKHPAAKVACTPLQMFDAPVQYDVVLALFGVGSYLSDCELLRLPTLMAPGGRFLVMFYRNGYIPQTYRATGVHCPSRPYSPHLLTGQVTPFGEFIIVTQQNKPRPE